MSRRVSALLFKKTLNLTFLHFFGHSYKVNVFYLVRSDPANGEVLVKQGSIVTVQCTATGNPSPSVTWTRLNQDKVGHNQNKLGHNQDKVGYNQDKVGHNQDKVGYNQDKVGYNQDKVGYNQNKVVHNQDKVRYNQDKVG